MSRMVSIVCAVVSAAAIAAPWDSARATEPPARLTPLIRTAVDGNLSLGYQYTYDISNDARADSPIVVVQFESATSQAWAPSGWGFGLPYLTLRANDARSGLLPGRTLRLKMTSPMLPGVTEAHIYGWHGPLPWDSKLQPTATVLILAPLIGSDKEQPVDAAIDILSGIDDDIVPALLVDQDLDADRIAQVIHDAANDLRRHNLAATDTALRSLPTATSQAPSLWRATLYDALQVTVRHVLDLIAHADTVLEVQQRPTEKRSYASASEEVSVDVGLSAPSTTNLSQFLANTDLAFVGVLEQVSVEFVDAAREDLRTRMAFRPTEVLKGSSHVAPGSTIVVWVRGGSYVNAGTARTPIGIAEVARSLRIGTTCFVPARRFAKPGSALNGQYWLDALDALARLEDGRVLPAAAAAGSTWIRSAVSQGQLLSPGANDEATLFLNALRRATSQ